MVVVDVALFSLWITPDPGPFIEWPRQALVEVMASLDIGIERA